jgi:GNAT superfamily N-acetyltransferase
MGREAMDVEYKQNHTVTNDELNALFRDAWLSPQVDRDFRPVLDRSLGYVCAFENEELIGFVNVAWDGGLHTFLLDTTVRSDSQRRGIGRELVRHAVALAREAGAEWLHVDFEPHLDEFYRACGFRETRAGLINLR